MLQKHWKTNLFYSNEISEIRSCVEADGVGAYKNMHVWWKPWQSHVCVEEIMEEHACMVEIMIRICMRGANHGKNMHVLWKSYVCSHRKERGTGFACRA